MKKLYFENREDAIGGATRLLTEGGNIEGGYPIEETTYGKVGEELFIILRNNTTSAFAYVFPLLDEWRVVASLYGGSLTYPFRGATERDIYLLCALGACFLKPVTPLSPDEARTAQGARTIYSFFGRDLDEELEEAKEKSYKAFELVPSILEEATGKSVKTASSFLKAVSSLVTIEDEEQREEALGSYNDFMKADYFLHYALYEFLRTEDYSHLREVLASYKTFQLSKEWEKSYPLFSKNETAEELIIGKYLNNEVREKIGVKSCRELADITGVPLSLLYKMNNKKDYWLWD